MPLHAPALFNRKDRQRQQQFRDYSEKLDIFKYVEPSWIHSRELKEPVHVNTSLLPIVSEKLWKVGEIFDNWERANISLLEKARVIPSALTQFVERSWSLPLGYHFQAQKGHEDTSETVTDLLTANHVCPTKLLSPTEGTSFVDDGNRFLIYKNSVYVFVYI